VTVVELVDRERARLARLTGALGGAAACAGLAIVLAVAVALLGDARWIALPAVVPFVAWGLAAVVLAAAAVSTVRALRHGATRADVARTIEQEQAMRRGSLGGALEVGTSTPLARRRANELADTLSKRESRAGLAPATGRRLRGRASVVGLVAAVGALACVVLAARAPDGLRAVMHPVDAWRGTLLPPLSIDAPADVLRGERATVRVSAPGRRRVAVATRARGDAWSTQWYPVRAGAAQVMVGPFDADLALVAGDGRAVSDTVTMRVSERPFLGGVALRAVYPAYLKRSSEALPAGEVARVPIGTRITINGAASTTLASVTLARATRDSTTLRIDGPRFSGQLTPTVGGRWDWRATSDGGATIADLPAPIEVEVVPDSAPTAEILAPARDTLVGADDRVVLSLAASDDHGLGSVVVRSWRQPGPGGTVGGDRPPEVTQRVVGAAPTRWTGDVMLDLATRGLQPGDAMHIVAVATDESPWRQTGMSRELVLRVPSLDEQRALARATGDSTASTAAQLAAAQRVLEQHTEDAARSRGQRQASGGGRGTTSGASSPSGQSSAMSYQSAEQAKQLADAQRQLADKVQALQAQSQQLQRQLKQAGALDSGLANELHEAQRLLSEALTPELKRELDKLNQNAQALKGGDSRATLGELAQEQQHLREQLERSAEVLKRAALEGSMQTMRDQARDLARRDSALASASPAPKGSAGAARQEATAEQLAQQTRDLSAQIDQLAKRLAQEKADVGAKKVGAAQPHAEASAKAMQTAAGKAPPPSVEPPAMGRGEPQGNRESISRFGDQSQSPTSRRSGDDGRIAPQTAAKGVGQQSGQQPGAQPGQQSGAQPGQQAGAQPGQQAGAQPGQQAGAQPGQQPGAQPGQQPGAQPGQQPGAQPGQQAGAQPGEQGGAQAGGQGGGEQQTAGGQESAAGQAAREMGEAAQQLSDARQSQIASWKSAVTSELDRSIQESLQMARQEDALAKQAQQGGDASALKSQQSAIQEGMQQAGQRLARSGRQSALISGGSQRAMGAAQGRVQDATSAIQQAQSNNPGGGGGEQAAGAMRDAADALNQAAASLVRDRERANSANSGSGMAEMLQQMQQLAQQQGALNAQSQGMSLQPGGANGATEGGGGTAQALANAQRRLANSLDAVGGGDASGRADAMAKEAREIAAALERNGPDPATLARQEHLYHRLLDAGHTLEQDERDSSGKREAQTAIDRPGYLPGATAVDGKSAVKFREPTWNELRGLTAEERQLVLDYFKRLNATP
jgi:hypothetical protein